MTLRKILKRWLYGSCPGFAGAFPYYGVKIHFPKGSVTFCAACEQESLKPPMSASSKPLPVPTLCRSRWVPT